MNNQTEHRIVTLTLSSGVRAYIFPRQAGVEYQII